MRALDGRATLAITTAARDKRTQASPSGNARQTGCPMSLSTVSVLPPASACARCGSRRRESGPSCRSSSGGRLRKSRTPAGHRTTMRTVWIELRAPSNGCPAPSASIARTLSSASPRLVGRHGSAKRCQAQPRRCSRAARVKLAPPSDADFGDSDAAERPRPAPDFSGLARRDHRFGGRCHNDRLRRERPDRSPRRQAGGNIVRAEAVIVEIGREGPLGAMLGDVQPHSHLTLFVP
jgi:hypothetical protein